MDYLNQNQKPYKKDFHIVLDIFSQRCYDMVLSDMIAGYASKPINMNSEKSPMSVSDYRDRHEVFTQA